MTGNVLLLLSLLHEYPLYTNASGVAVLGFSAMVQSVGLIVAVMESKRRGWHTTPSMPFVNMIFMLTLVQLLMVVYYFIITCVSLVTEFKNGDNNNTSVFFPFTHAVMLTVALASLTRAYSSATTLTRSVGAYPQDMDEFVDKVHLDQSAKAKRRRRMSKQHRKKAKEGSGAGTGTGINFSS
jgi:uncharacterized membrane protein